MDAATLRTGKGKSCRAGFALAPVAGGAQHSRIAMSESTAPPPGTSPIVAPRWAVRLGAATVVGFVAIVALTFNDSSHRIDLERTSETTAVGDAAFFTLPAAPLKLPLIAARLAGQPLYLTSVNPVEIRDLHVTRAARDGELTLYQLAPEATDKERQRFGKAKGAYLVKLKPGAFLKVQAAAK